MNKFFKFIFLFCFLVFSYKVNASESYTFSCDYKITSSEGKQIDVKVKVRELPVDYLNGNSGTNYASKVQTFVMNNDGLYKQIVSTCESGGYANAPSNNSKLCILTEGGNRNGSDKDSFLKEAFSSGSPKCPNLYQRQDYEKGISLTVSSGLGDEGYSRAASTISLNCYQNDLSTAYNCNEVLPHDSNLSELGNGGESSDTPAGGFGEGASSCYDILGVNLTNIVSTAITFAQILGAIIAIVNASLAIIPAVTNPDKVGEAKKKCINMGVILVALGVFKPVVIVIGNILGFDLTCFR